MMCVSSCCASFEGFFLLKKGIIINAIFHMLDAINFLNS